MQQSIWLREFVLASRPLCFQKLIKSEPIQTDFFTVSVPTTSGAVHAEGRV